MKIFRFLLVLIFSFLMIYIGPIPKVDALVPVTYTCCKDYSYSNGSLMDDFEAVPTYQIDNFEATPNYQIDNFDNYGNWTVGESGILTNDTINFVEGQQALKLTATNGNRSILDKAINNNFANANAFTLWIYVYDLSTFLEGTIYFTSTSNYSKYFTLSIQNLKQGWNKLTFDKQKFNNVNGEDWNNTMSKIRLAAYPQPGKNSTVSFDNLGYNFFPDWEELAGSVQADTVNYIEGKQGLKIITKNGSECFGGYNCGIADKIINNNFANATDFSIWLYVEDVSTFYQGSLFLTSTGSSWTKYFSISLQNIHQGWNNMILDKNSFKNNNNDNWNNTMNMMRLITYSQPGTSSNATFDDFRYDKQHVFSGTAGIIMPDTINYKDGQQGLKLVSINGSEIEADKSINANFANVNNFAFWIYVDNASNLGYIRLILTSTGSNFSSYFYDSFGRYGYSQSVRNGWNEIVFNKHTFKNGFNESWNNIMNKIRLDVAANPGKNVNVTVDNLRYNLTGQRAKLFIEFDDGLNDTYSTAYPILKANNQNATVFVVPSYINKTGYMTLDQARELQSGGWDIGSHSFDHPDLATLNDSALTYEFNGSYNWLIDNNFQKAAGYIAYPFGTYSPHTLDLAQKRYLLGRSTQWESAVQHFNEDPSIWLVQRIITVEQPLSTVQFIKDNINDTINSKLLGVLVFHNIVDSNPALYDYTRSDFIAVSNYIKSRSADIDVIRESDYVTTNINSFTPVINKTTRIYSNGSSVLITNNEYDEYMPNMTVMPSSDSIDMKITVYNETGGLIKFNESSAISSIRTLYSIGDRIPNQAYSVKIYWNNGTKYQDFNVMSNNTGYIKYNSSGFGSPRYQEITTTKGFNLSGYVFGNNGSGLNAVLVQNGSFQNITTVSGSYLIRGLSNGTYNFSYSKAGYNTGYLEVRINGSDNKSGNITIYDTTPPIITLNGSKLEIIDINSTYIDAGATAFDTADGDITSRIITNNSVNTYISGIYNVTYNVADYADNNATQVNRTVKVLSMPTYSTFNIIYNVNM